MMQINVSKGSNPKSWRAVRVSSKSVNYFSSHRGEQMSCGQKDGRTEDRRRELCRPSISSKRQKTKQHGNICMLQELDAILSAKNI